VRDSYNQENAHGDFELSLIDVLRFLKSTYKTVLFFGVLGVAVAITYLSITPEKFEARAQIAMAQISVSTKGKFGMGNNISSNNIMGANIEDPALLITRLSNPTSFLPVTTDACGLRNQSNAGLNLVNNIKLTIAKGITNVVELKTLGSSQEAAFNCAAAIFELVRESQSQILSPYVSEAKIRLMENQERLEKVRALALKMDNSGLSATMLYISTRDEIRYLLEEIDVLRNVVNNNQNRTAYLISPIYVNDSPVTPKKYMTLVGGLFGGLFLGLLIVLVRQMVAKLKSQVGEVL